MNDVVRQYTSLAEPDLDLLHRLVADWQLLADLSFADLVLWVVEDDRADTVPVGISAGGSSTNGGYRAAAQMRPTTGPTAYIEDLVGNRMRRGRRPLVDAAFDHGVIRRDGDPEWWDDVPVRVEAIPVMREGRVIAVVTRNTNLTGVRTPSRLELVYLECAGLLARMIAAGAYPQPGVHLGRRGAPRVGDGMIRLDASGIITYGSPNAISAFRRLGLAADFVGESFGPMTSALAPGEGPMAEPLATLLSGRAVFSAEVANGAAALTVRVIPLASGAEHVGAIVLCRDVSELRRREMELLSKDATIREIHHRVKNNLQTVAALLRIQGRRVHEESARVALAEAERRVDTIALVHETLATTADDSVAFDDVAQRLMSMLGDVAAPSHAVRTKATGSFGVLPATLATPLAMVLNELLQNAVEHGSGPDGGTIEVSALQSEGQLTVSVEDDGVGLPADFDLASSTRMGLQIVRTLVSAELNASIEFQSVPAGGTRVVVVVPLPNA